MDSSILIVLAILAGTVFMLVLDVVRIDVVAILSMLALAWSGVILRSSLATNILMQRGFKTVYNVAGGMTGYSAAGYARQCQACENPHGSRF